jgi:hypothetical protein
MGITCYMVRPTGALHVLALVNNGARIAPQSRLVTRIRPRRTASKENPEALQGFHAEHLLFLIDEASGIPDVVFEVGMGALSTLGAKVLMAGNPTRTSGFFYDTHHSLRNRWQTMHVSCLDVPRAQGHIQDIKAKYGDNSNAWRVRPGHTAGRRRTIIQRGRCELHG